MKGRLSTHRYGPKPFVRIIHELLDNDQFPAMCTAIKFSPGVLARYTLSGILPLIGSLDCMREIACLRSIVLVRSLLSDGSLDFER